MEEQKNVIEEIDNYLIKIDSSQFIVNKKYDGLDKDGKIREGQYTYHPDLEDAIKEIFLRKRTLKLMKVNSLKEAIKEIKECDKNLQKYLDKILKD